MGRIIAPHINLEQPSTTNFITEIYTCRNEQALPSQKENFANRKKRIVK